MRSDFARSDLQPPEAIYSSGEVNPKAPGLAMAIWFLALRIIALTAGPDAKLVFEDRSLRNLK